MFLGKDVDWWIDIKSVLEEHCIEDSIFLREMLDHEGSTKIATLESELRKIKGNLKISKVYLDAAMEVR